MANKRSTAFADNDLDVIVEGLFKQIADLRIRLQSEPLEALGELRSIVKSTRRHGLYAPMARAIAALVEVNHFLGRMREMDRQTKKLAEVIPLIEDPIEQTLMRSIYGVSLSIRGRFEDAFAVLDSASREFEEYGVRDQKYINTLYSLGIVKLRLMEYDAALGYLLQCQELATELNHTVWIASIATQIGTVYGHLDELEEARVYMEKARTIFLTENLVQYLFYPVQSLGRIHLELGETETAFRYYEEARGLSSPEQSPPNYYSMLTEFGHAYNRMGRHHEALALQDSVLRYAESEDVATMATEAQKVIAYAYRCLHLSAEAIEAYSRLAELTNHTSQHHYTLEAHEALAALYEEAGDPVRALEHQKEYARLYRDLFGTKRQRAVAHAEQEHQRKEAGRRQQSLEQRLEEAESEIEDGRRELNALTIDAQRLRVALERLSALAKTNGSLPDARKLLEGMREILSGAYSPADRNRLLDEQFERTHREFIHRLRRRSTALTPTEIKISVLIRIGMASKEIADTLFSAPATVETHRKRIRRKLGVPPQANLTTHLIEI